MAKKTRPTDRHANLILDAMLGLAGEIGWRRTSLAGIAEKAKVSLAELYERYDGKAAILDDFYERLNEALVKGELPAAGESTRNRLFDVMMRRFEAMQPHKPAIRAIVRESTGDPWMWLCAAPRLLKTAALTLEAAGISAWGPVGRMKARGVAVIYAATFRAWLADDSEDMAKTMAQLDRSLKRAEEVVIFLCRGGARLPKADDEVGAGTA
jgi:AcrR family transcriptional regulator